MADISSTIETYCATFTAGDREGWLACWAEGATMEDPVGTPVKKGKDEIGAFYDQGQQFGPVALIPTGQPHINGDEAAFEFRIEVKMGDQTLTTTAIDVMKFDSDARIVAQRAFVDLTKLAPSGGGSPS
jgi:steroid delta-isomerase